MKKKYEKKFSEIRYFNWTTMLVRHFQQFEPISKNRRRQQHFMIS